MLYTRLLRDAEIQSLLNVWVPTLRHARPLEMTADKPRGLADTSHTFMVVFSETAATARVEQDGRGLLSVALLHGSPRAAQAVLDLDADMYDPRI